MVRKFLMGRKAGKGRQGDCAGENGENPSALTGYSYVRKQEKYRKMSPRVAGKKKKTEHMGWPDLSGMRRRGA